MSEIGEGDAAKAVLVVYPGRLVPVEGGSATRVWSLIGHLRDRGFGVGLATVDHGADRGALEGRVDRLWTTRRSGRGNAMTRWPRAGLRAVYARVPWLRRAVLRMRGASALERQRLPALERLAAEAAGVWRPVAVIAVYARTARCLDRVPESALRVVDTIDVQHLRVERARAAGEDLGEFACTRDEEIVELARADVLLAIQAEDQRALQSMCPDKEVVVVGHAAVSGEYEPSPPNSREVLYVGNRYAPNVAGLKIFLAEVWPEVRRAHAQARLTVCGRIGEAFSRPVEGVTFEGVVEDLAPYYARAAVVVNPVAFGTGLKIKSVEALAHGRCLVTTEAGLLGLGDAVPATAAPLDASMAKPIGALFEDAGARHDQERRAWEFARERLGPEQVYGALVDAILRGKRGSD